MNKKYQPPGQVLSCCPLQPVRYGQMKMPVHFHPDIPGPHQPHRTGVKSYFLCLYNNNQHQAI